MIVGLFTIVGAGESVVVTGGAFVAAEVALAGGGKVKAGVIGVNEAVEEGNMSVAAGNGVLVGIFGTHKR